MFFIKITKFFFFFFGKKIIKKITKLYSHYVQGAGYEFRYVSLMLLNVIPRRANMSF